MNSDKTTNPFFSPFTANHGAIPFDRIKVEHYEPAIVAGIEAHRNEVDAIAVNADEPSFDNTIVALERSGELLTRVLNVFFPMLSADGTEQMYDISNRITPMLTEHFNSINLNERLWQRIKAVHDSFDAKTHDVEDARLMHNTYRAFIKSGAALEGDDRDTYRKLTTKLSTLTQQFQQNALRATAAYQMRLTGKDLDGLPESAVAAAAETAREQRLDGEYVVTLQAPSYVPFMKYSTRRDLREQLYKAYNSQAVEGENSNMAILVEIANTRLAIARLLGCENFAQYSLEDKMAEKPQNVFDMLDRLQEAYRKSVNREMKTLREFAEDNAKDTTFTLMPWDYSFYFNKLKMHLHNIDDEVLRPYFELNKVIDGVFGLATRLYGLQFKPNSEAPVYNPDVKVFDVQDEHGNFMGLLYTDFFPRATKQSGAWMTNYREQRVNADGIDERPIVTLTMNFTKPTADKPSLLTLNEVNTFIHEFGHGLHSLLSKCRYESLSGTNVYRDFVELPSQFNENYTTEPEFLHTFARHYLTDEPIPDELIERIVKAKQFGAAYACFRQLGFGYLDMAWHTLTEPFEGKVFDFEHEAMHAVSVFEPVDGCCMSSHFGHIFAGGYAAGYYGYKWAEVLDADAFEKFKDEGIFNRDTARAFCREILSRGGTEHPATLYRRWRGRDPEITALLIRDGVTAEKVV